MLRKKRSFLPAAFIMAVAQVGNNSGHFWAVGYSGRDTLILQC